MAKEYDTPLSKFCSQLPYGGQSELARKAGITPQYLHTLIKGDRKPGPITCAKLMAANPGLTMGILRSDAFVD